MEIFMDHNHDESIYFGVDIFFRHNSSRRGTCTSGEMLSYLYGHSRKKKGKIKGWLMGMEW